jgi:hypothetical protein
MEVRRPRAALSGPGDPLARLDPEPVATGPQVLFVFSAAPLVYPKPRYEVPILMHPENFAWLPVEGREDVAEKFMGTFTERQISARFLKLAPGAEFKVSGGRDVYVVLKGAGDLQGEDYGLHTALFLEAKGEGATFKAREETELLHYHLPDLAPIKAAGTSQVEMQAAE